MNTESAPAIPAADREILRRLAQAPDHVESLAFPEGLYLKGLLVRAE